MDSTLVLMDSKRIGRSVKRMGYEIVEHNTSSDPIILFGIDQRGYAVAQLLENVLGPIFSGSVRALQFSLKNGSSGETLPELETAVLQHSFPIVVDDVIFSGETMFYALKKITATLEPEEIHSAVLVDRGHRKFPIQAQFCGLELPTKLNEHVRVVVEEMEIEEVILEKV